MKRSGPGRAALVIAIALVAMIPSAHAPRSPSADHGRPAPLLRAAAIPASVGAEDDPDAQAEMEFMMLRDPRTNAIPRDIRRRETAFARGLPRRGERGLRNGPDREISTQTLVWTERGPNNVGGRTRAFAVDVSNSTALLAGSVAGGIWRSTDDGASWSQRLSPGQIHGTTCIAQDKRSGQTGTWYVGTGEIRGSTTNATRWGSLYLGDGIFKSTDGGSSWTLLPSTSSGTPQTANAFDFVIDVATNPANVGQDEVLAATFRGIYRSIDGGGAWNQVLPSDSSFTDVAVTDGGVMYAITRVAGLIKVWRSTTGNAWNLIQPATFPTVANRIAIGLAPSNPNVVYFFAQGVNQSGPAGHQIWKYTYLSGDGSGAGGTWLNRASSLPFDISTQSGYDQTIQVKPDDENFVIIGGTNLYRSTDGFATAGSVTLIGGYPFFPQANHHPDLHAGAFSPADSKVYYSAGDGGISKAADITLADMVWTSLNHGYNVTQFYSVALAPEAGSDLILAGAQDNGSQLGNAPGASDWVMAYGGDGTVVEVAPAADDRIYTQYQGGQIQRLPRDLSDFPDCTPAGATNQLFVDPIVLDPNNSALLYYAAGTTGSNSMIWRNDNAPLATPTTGWTSLPSTNVGTATGYVRRISALGISTANNPNVLYYGTDDGIVMKAVNANTGSPTVTNVSPPGLNAGSAFGGFVRCVAVDPANSEQALVAFGNYNFPSLWYTTDGGASWTNVEGNLAGASGPSIRWATMFTIDGQLEVFLGTSIGVLSTTALAGTSTVWIQEAGDVIGNVIVGYMDFRASDNTLAVGTHGRGVFTGQFVPVTAAGDRPAGPERALLSQSYPNPARAEATIAFELPRAGDVSLRLYDVSGREVAVLVNGRREPGRHEVPVATGRLAPGAYYYVLRAGSTVETRKMLVRR